MPGTTAESFQHYLRMVFEHTKLPCLGIVIVNQEGKEAAGSPSQIFQVRDTTLQISAALVAEALSNCLSNGTPLDDEFLRKYNAFVTEIVGNFRTTVGYLFSIGNPADYHGVLAEFSRHVSLTMENSKKSEFHKKFSSNLPDVILNNLASLISETIRSGLYADKVIVWEINGEKLVSEGEPNFNMLVNQSLAGDVLRTGQSRTVDNVAESRETILFRSRLIAMKLNAFFLIPVHSAIEKRSVGVVGVFFKRPFGTTDVDLELATYVVKYFEVIWNVIARNVELERVGQLDEEARRFHSDAVSCILKFHDISDIRMGLKIAYDELDVLTGRMNDPKVRENIELFNEQLKRLRKLHSSQEIIFRRAEDYESLFSARNIRKNESVDLEAFVRKELAGLERSAQSLGIRLKLTFSMKKKRYFLDKEDLTTLTSNLVSNAIRAIEKRPNVQENFIVVVLFDAGKELVISVQDSGVGIAPYDLEKIFDLHYSTNRDVGGQGLGLAVVKATCLKHGNVPRVESKFGRGTEITVRLRHY